MRQMCLTLRLPGFAVTLLAGIFGLLKIQSALAQDVSGLRKIPLIILAGQSNAVGYDAKPSELPASDIDRQILFWWKCGDPPPDAHDSIGAQWSHLQAQPLGNPIKPRNGRQYGNFAEPDGGFGPEIGFARKLYSIEKRPVAIIKVAFSGTGLGRDWDPNSSDERGACFRALVQEIRAAGLAAEKRKFELRPRAFLWVQGESDANATDAPLYANRFRQMLNALRHELEAPRLSALLAVNTRFQEGKNLFMPGIVAAQQQFAASDANSVYVDTASASIANPVHYDAKGTLLVGEMFATELIKLERSLK